ncbi:MAG: HD-GYP domain-containing protein [Lachnospiraceae bacterium]|nr:HD-GYP domain-containing protein [Lachnospiraceae bacterium]
MFFTNGGAEGGTPVWLLLGTLYISMILEGRFRVVMLVLNALVSLICWIFGYFNPEYIVRYTRGGNFFDSFAGLLIVSVIVYVLIAFRSNLLRKEEEFRNAKRLFEQTAVALVNAIDAKDEYTRGHSARVAEYSRKLAEANSKSQRECEEVYYAALLHDVGKIGIPESIITKNGKLTKEEYATIKQHPAFGAQILQSITEFPYLSIGAQGHHERYDGKGYPYGLKGSDIPELARIISVADAYDAMSSKRSYRDPIPQQIVREEIVKGTGTQFDPVYARLMLHLIDVDTEYEMSERGEALDLDGKNELLIDEYRSEISEGILMGSCMMTVRMKISPYGKAAGAASVPSLIIFDSLDGYVHEGEKEIKDLNYYEYGEIWLDGRTHTGGARKIRAEVTKTPSSEIEKDGEYRIEAVKIKDHAMLRIVGKKQTIEVIIALPDCSRYAYIALTGEHCRISDVSSEKAEEECPQDYIPRIAEEISYIKGPVGDVPNVQIDGYRSDASDGVEIKDGLAISFHAMSLPTARLVWHCPFVDVFSSDDGKVNGENYRDLAFVRFDGEGWQCDPDCDLKLSVTTRESFEGWDAWKEFNRQGFDATVSFKVEEDKITVITENAGIAVRSTVIINGINKPRYASITGDQIAITDIHVKYP